MKRAYRKPLIVMTPKSLLRHKMAVSPTTELSNGQFELILRETESIDASKTRRVVFCSGKVYYDLLEARRVQGIDDVAIVRVEQIYPFPVSDFATVLKQYDQARDIVWCQEEPKNQGAWYQIRHRLQEPLSDDQQLYYAGRLASAAPASGVFKVHLQQQQALVEAALGFKALASNAVRPRKTKRKPK